MFAYEIPFCWRRGRDPLLSQESGILILGSIFGFCHRDRKADALQGPVLFWAEACHTEHWFTVSLVKVCKSVSMMLERNV